jgi:hypothetical protein
MPRVVIALIVLSLLFFAACPEGYPEENAHLLWTLPELPGAARKDVDHYVFYPCEGGCRHRHAILVTYEAPAGVTDQDVIDFYLQALTPEWRCQIEKFPMFEEEEPSTTPTLIAETLNAACQKGSAQLSVNTDGMGFGDGHTFEVHVDSRGAEPR